MADKFISIFRDKHKGKHSKENFLPAMVDLRCNLLAYHFLLWTLFVIFAPDKIKIDPYDSLCVRGGLQLRAFVSPDGIVSRRQITCSTEDYKKYEPHMRLIKIKMTRLCDFYKLHKFDSRRGEDIGITDFFDIWKLVVPKRFIDKRALMLRVADLCKFYCITYSVKDFKTPFE